MKTLISALLILASGIVNGGTIYRCDNVYQAQPCRGKATKTLQYTPMTQAHIDRAEYAALERDLIANVENERLATIEWLKFNHQLQKDAAQQEYLNKKLNIDQTAANYQRAQAIMQFKYSREYQIHQRIKDHENEMLDNIAWQSIQHRDDIVWHHPSDARRTPWLSDRRR
jgi:hypothetical protein